MPITTLDTLIAALPGQESSVIKGTFSPQAVGCFTALWVIAGKPGAGVDPSGGVGGATVDDSVAGAITFTNPTAPALSYLARFNGTASQNGMLFLYDRLWHNSGLSATSLTAQTVSSVTLPARCPDGAGGFDTNGKDVEAWFQVFNAGAMGSGSTAPSISYTDQSGNASNTGTLIGFATTAAANRTFPFSFASGDTGVRSIQSYTNGATMTSGSFGLVLRRRIASVPVIVAGDAAYSDAISGHGLPKIADDTAFEFLWLAGSTSTTLVAAAVQLAQG